VLDTLPEIDRLKTAPNNGFIGSRFVGITQKSAITT
jgi:hypothetical protein